MLLYDTHAGGLQLFAIPPCYQAMPIQFCDFDRLLALNDSCPSMDLYTSHFFNHLSNSTGMIRPCYGAVHGHFWVTSPITDGTQPGCGIAYIEVIGTFTRPYHTGDTRPCHGGYIPVSQENTPISRGIHARITVIYTPMYRERFRYSHGPCSLQYPRVGPEKPVSYYLCFRYTSPVRKDICPF